MTKLLAMTIKLRKQNLLWKFLMGCFLFITCLPGAEAQIQTVSGFVRSATDNQPIEGATVQVRGTSKGTITDQNGEFSLSGVEPKSVIVFTSTGFVTEERRLEDKYILSILLKQNSNELNEVVVVGYGNQKRGDLTGAIASVKMPDLLKAPVRSFDEALAGRVAGVQVSSSDGQPGSAISIIIRGNNSVTQNNSPLYVVDGFPLEDPDNNIINPHEIASIEVLKDASATAIYGARGSNGVIIITTKRGVAGPPVISLNTSVGFQKVTKKMDLMTPYEFVKYQSEYDPVGTDTTYFKDGKTLESYKNQTALDFQDKVFRTAPVQSHNLFITGGNANTRYAVSGSLFDQSGVIINSGYKRYQGRFSIDQTINTKLKMGLNTNYSTMIQSGYSPSQSTNSATQNIMYSVWGYRPFSVDNKSGILLEDALFDPGIDGSNDYRFNPVVNLENLVKNNVTKDIIAQAFAEYAITAELKLRVTGGINNSMLKRETFYNSKTFYGGPTSSVGVNGAVYFVESNSWLNENTLAWNKSFNEDHNLNILGGFTAQHREYSNYGVSATQLPNESLGVSGLDEGAPEVVTATSSYWNLSSFLGRVNYGYKSKYLLTASFRTDGSSKFNRINHWSYFPSAAFAWRLSNENFMKGIDNISDAKLRISYGVTGNNRVGDFAYLSSMGLPMSSSYTINNTPIRGVVPVAIGNPNLKWETTAQFDIGLDLGLFDQLIILTADAYHKKTKNLLLNATLPTSTGYTNAFKNIGSMLNEGIEFTLNTVNITNRDFSWNSSFNIAFYRNKVLALNENQDFFTTGLSWDNLWVSTPAYIAEVGQPIGLMYGYIWEGVYQYSDFDKIGNIYTLKSSVPTNGNTRANIKPGDIKYQDRNGDGVVNAKDYTVIGRGFPKNTGGFINNFTYKNFDLNIFLQWSYGNDLLNANRIAFDGNSLTKGNLNQYSSYEDRWSSENTNSKNFRTKGFFGGGYSSRFVEDGSYLRLKTVSLGYNLPFETLQKRSIKSFRLYVSAQNLITWTNYSGMDPEVSVYETALTPGFDYSAYPRARTITFGINVNF